MEFGNADPNIIEIKIKINGFDPWVFSCSLFSLMNSTTTQTRKRSIICGYSLLSVGLREDIRNREFGNFEKKKYCLRETTEPFDLCGW